MNGEDPAADAIAGLARALRMRDGLAAREFEPEARRRLNGFCVGYLGDADAAEDVVQDAFVKLWRKPGSWDAEKGAKFTTWFTRVVTNTALDHLRKKRPDADTDQVESAQDKKDFTQEIEMSEQQAALEEAIQSLPERQQMALNLCFYDEMSNKDAAEMMDIGVKALESLLMRAKAGVRDTLTRNGVLEKTEVRHVG